MWVDDDVVDRIELSTMEGGNERCAPVRHSGIRYEDEPAGVRLTALGAVEEAVLVVDAAVPHALGVVFGRCVVDANFGGVIVIEDTGDLDEFVGS